MAGPIMQGVQMGLARRESDRARRLQEQTGQLAGSAYMGDPQAMADLMAVNPQAGIEIQRALQQRTDASQQASLQKRSQANQEFESLMTDIAKFDDFGAAKGFAETRMADMQQRFPEITRIIGVDAVFDESDFQQAKTLFGEGSASAFAGTSMDAQVSNMLSKGVEDPEFRKSPEYARAWQMANEPKIIRTPTGDITLRPELSGMFKAPGEVLTDEQQTKDVKQAVKRDVEVIRGTEREEKTTADEKLSFGFFGRMRDAEDNIKALGDYDSADVWERFKGLTNVTAGTELQSYRQAADDWVRAKLRRESGAAIAPGEMDSEYKIYFPQIGDKQAVIDQKRRARITAQEAMKTAAGGEFKKQEKAKSGDLAKRAAELEKELDL